MSEIDEILKAVLSDNKTDKSTSDEAGQTDNEEKFTTDTESDDIFGGINIDMFMKIGEIMSKMSEQDKNTELLLALKPHLRDENQAKIDTAVKLFRLISLLPYLKDSGLKICYEKELHYGMEQYKNVKG